MTAAPAAVDADRLRGLVRAVVVAMAVGVTVVFDPRSGYYAAGPKWRLLLVGGALAGIVVLAVRRRGLAGVAANPLRGPVLVLVAWTAVSAVASGHRHVALVGFPGSYDGLWTALALAALFFAAAALSPGDVRPVLRGLWFVAAPVVVAVGLIELADRSLRGDSPGATGATFGNPNHLASFLAVALPLGVVLAALGGHRARVASAAIAAGALVELGVTLSRGGLVAAVAGLAVLGVLLRDDLRPHMRMVGRAAAVTVVVVVLAALVAGATGNAKRDVGGLVRVGRGSTADLRLQVWAIALHVAADHPVTGVGPDGFGVVFPAYSTARFRSEFGPFTVANGAHDVFLNTAADLGVVGLVALLAVLARAAVVVRRGWREVDGRPDQRLLLAGVSAALVAYLVQACGNVQELSLSVCFWVLLGLTVALAIRPATGTARPAAPA